MAYLIFSLAIITAIKHAHLSRAFVATIAALALSIVAPASSADDDGDEIPFDVANIFFELNDTDGDLGIHALIDGEAWKKLEIEAPNGRENLEVWVKGRLRRQGLTELFFESAEPPFNELTPEEFFRRFPAGDYEIEGKTLEGDELESTAVLTHVMPAPPGNVTINGIRARPVDASQDCDEEDPPIVRVVNNAVTMSWDPVTTSHPDIGASDSGIEIIRYQAVAEWEDESENVFVSSVDVQSDGRVAPATYDVTVSPEFFVNGTEGKFEVLVREASGNQTAVESCPFQFVVP